MHLPLDSIVRRGDGSVVLARIAADRPQEVREAQEMPKNLCIPVGTASVVQIAPPSVVTRNNKAAVLLVTPNTKHRHRRGT